jgi:uncharacterized protein YbcI
MHCILNNAEKTVAQPNSHHDVTDRHQLVQQHMGPGLRAGVERLTADKVLAVLSSRHLEAEAAAELFILDTALSLLGTRKLAPNGQGTSPPLP